jgi:hypothetical protein
VVLSSEPTRREQEVDLGGLELAGSEAILVRLGAG